MLLYDKQTAKARVEIEKAQQSAKLAVVSDALGTIADAVGRESAAGKAFAVAQAVINTYQGATKALATYPPPFGAIAAGAVIVQGLMSVKKIVSTKLPAPPGGKSAPSDTAGNAVSDTSKMTISNTGAVTIPGTLGVTGQFSFGERAFLNSTTRISVAGATTIYSIINTGSSVGASVALVLVNGYLVATPTNSFVDLVLFMPSGTPVVISSINRGSPAARTYTSSGNSLQLAMASGTYNVANSNTEQAC